MRSPLQRLARANAGTARVVASIQGDEGTLVLHGLVGACGGEGTSSADFLAQLDSLKGTETVHLRLNSPGGDAFDGVAMGNALRDFPARVVAHVEGVAASAATIIAMGADEVHMAPGALFMVHNAWAICVGDSREMQKEGEVLGKVDESMAATYARRTGRPVAKVKAWMDAETWFSADEAVAAGFADSVERGTSKVDARASFDLSVYDNQPTEQPAKKQRQTLIGAQMPVTPKNSGTPAKNHPTGDKTMQLYPQEERAQVAQKIQAMVDDPATDWDDPETKARAAGHKERLAELDHTIDEIEKITSELNRKASLRDLASGGTFSEGGQVAEYLRTGDRQAATDLDSAPGGGFMIPSAIDDHLAVAMKEHHPFRDLCEVADCPTAHAAFSKLIVASDAGAAWTSETGTRTDQGAPDIRKITFPESELYARVPVSRRLIEDAQFDVMATVIDSAGRTFGAAEAAAFVNGTGTDQPRGFLTGTINELADDARDFGHIQKITATSITATKLLDMTFALAASYRKKAAWVMSPEAIHAVRGLTDNENRHVWADSLASGQPARLLGLPVYESSAMGGIGSGGIPIALADWRAAYGILDRAATFQRDMYSGADNGLVIIRVRRRVTGALLDSSALKVLELTT